MQGVQGFGRIEAPARATLLRVGAAVLKPFRKRTVDLREEKFTDAFERELLDREARSRHW